MNKPVHPHGRGDNRSSPESRIDNHGSPPRAWGQSRASAARWGAFRFTPTGVGTIRRRPARRIRRAVHPHGRGDNTYPSRSLTISYGSPPRAWGQC